MLCIYSIQAYLYLHVSALRLGYHTLSLSGTWYFFFRLKNFSPGSFLIAFTAMTKFYYLLLLTAF
jgi:hypothetical protein